MDLRAEAEQLRALFRREKKGAKGLRHELDGLRSQDWIEDAIGRMNRNVVSMRFQAPSFVFTLGIPLLYNVRTSNKEI